MTQLRVRMIEDMKLAGLAQSTQEAYVAVVRSLSKHYGKRPPDQLSEEEVRQYLLGVRERCARGTFKLRHYGLQFLYQQTLGRDWALFKKRSGCRSKSGCRRPSPMPRFGAFSAPSATRSTAAASA